MPVLLKSPGGWEGMSGAVLEIAYDVVIDGKGATTGPTSNTDLSVKCRSCPRKRTFFAPNERLLARLVASSGWNIEAGVAECPGCWMAYQASVMRAARGNT
jgi:hypothetical protein